MSVAASLARLLRARSLELASSAVAFLVFAAFSGPMLLRQSSAPHFVYQAAGFLRGSLSIPVEFPPGWPHPNDWVKWGEHWYSSFPPFPALLMAPFVAVCGLGFNDVFFTVCVAAINVGLFVALLRALRDDGQHRRTDRELLLLTAFWAFGSVYFCSAIRGEVWFTAHVVGVGLTLVYLLASLRGRAPIVAGLAFGAAAMTRANLVYAAPFFLLETILSDGWPTTRQAWVDRLRATGPALARFAVPAGLVILAGLWMNHARFGRWGEFGHTLLYDNRVNDRIRAFGLFNPHFLPGNLRSAFLLMPTVSWSPFRVGFDGNGMSMFVTTPLLLGLVASRSGARSTMALWFTTLCVAVPGLLYMNNGWFQFGYRFSNDYLPYLFMLLATGSRPMTRGFIAAGAAGIVVSTWGACVFGR